MYACVRVYLRDVSGCEHAIMQMWRSEGNLQSCKCVS